MDDEFKELMHFLDTSEIREYNSEFVNDMTAALVRARSNEEWRISYMSLELLMNECKAEGRNEGREERGRENALAMLKDKMGEALVAKYSGLSLEEVHSLATTL